MLQASCGWLIIGPCLQASVDDLIESWRPIKSLRPRDRRLRTYSSNNEYLQPKGVLKTYTPVNKLFIMVQLVAVALYHRNHFSLGNARQAFGYEAYHWSIMVMPEIAQEDEETCHLFDATDTSAINPETFRMNNPKMEWWYRSQIDVNPHLNMKLLGRVVFGQIPDEISSAELDEFFRNIPLPVKNTYPQQSSVSWAIDAICAIQKQGWAPEFDLRKFKDFALAYGDERMQGSESKELDVKHFDVMKEDALVDKEEPLDDDESSLTDKEG